MKIKFLSLLLIPLLASCQMEPTVTKTEATISQYDENFKKQLINTNAEISQSYKSLEHSELNDLLSKSSSFENKIISAAVKGKTFKENTNTVISPLSVFSNLSMITEISANETRNELLNSMNLNMDELHNVASYMTNEFNYSNSYTGKNSILTNSMWINDDFSVKQECIDNLYKYYGCESHFVNFKTKNQESNDEITKYVNEKTNGLLNYQSNIKPNELMTLINTFYYSSKWDQDKYHNGKLYKSSSTSIFKNSDGTETNTNFLSTGKYTKKIYTNELYKAISFSYDGTLNSNLLFVVPNENSSFESILTTNELEKLSDPDLFNGTFYETNTKYKTSILFPKFNAEYNGNITDTIRNNLNIQKAYSDTDSDFRNLTDSENIALNSTSHQAKIKVNEEGIEGAALTSSILYGESEEKFTVIEEKFVVDRPFAFIFTYKSLPIFSGVINII